MAELLLELFSEEIPARMQAPAAEHLVRLLTAALSEAGLEHDEPRAFATPRRLTAVVSGLPAVQADTREERKGPRVGAPEKAMEGFLRSTGLTMDQLQTQEDKKGSFYLAVIEKKGGPTKDALPDLLGQVINDIPWPKSMRWGAGSFRWVRPLKSILCVFDGESVPVRIDLGAGRELVGGDETAGHRFIAPKPFTVTGFDDYEAKLRDAHVILSGDERKVIISEQAAKLAEAEGLEVIPDPGLLDEVAGLVEDPIVLLGTIDERFLAVPPEVLTTAMRTHQKYFSLRNKETGAFAPRFLVVSNLRATDGGKAIVNGNERVLRARLSDAEFFWEQDKKRTLAARLPELQNIVFHEKLGTVAERVDRIEKLAREIAPLIGADADDAARAAQLAKADLVTGMVGEFPELQGLMGYYYAREDGEREDVAMAVRDQYKPQGPSDGLPEGKVGAALALADKLDVLTGFWAIGEKPTGSKDPFALRRAALGVVRTGLESKLRIALTPLIDTFLGAYQSSEKRTEQVSNRNVFPETQDLLSFIADRLKVYLRDRGARHDLVDAVFSLPGQDDLVLIVARVDALSNFLGTEDGANLLAAYKRAANILRIEEKKDGKAYDADPSKDLLADEVERELFEAVSLMQPAAAKAVEAEDFEGAMAALAQLRAPLDRFFEEVTVNAEDASLRANRLSLLSLIRRSMEEIADFSKIEG